MTLSNSDSSNRASKVGMELSNTASTSLLMDRGRIVNKKETTQLMALTLNEASLVCARRI